MKQTGMLVVSLRGVNFGFWILVSLRVFQVKRQYFMPPSSRLARVPRSNTDLREEKQKSNFLLNFLFR